MTLALDTRHRFAAPGACDLEKGRANDCHGRG
jgi:hypothetical protein